MITSASGNRFAKDGTDWKWWNACVPGELRKLEDQGYADENLVPFRLLKDFELSLIHISEPTRPY